MVRISVFLWICSLYLSVIYQVIDQPNIPPIQSTGFYGANVAWLVTNRGVILRTKDGGDSWKDRSPNAPARFEQLSFIDMQTGWTIDSEAQVWRTTNTGVTWKRIAKLDYTSSPFVGPIEQITFIDRLHGWIVDPFSVWRTEDGGFNWRRHTPLAESRKRKELIHRCSFINPRTGWLGGENATIYRTADGGRTWREERLATQSDMAVSGISFIDENRGWTCGWPHGGVFYTNDGGSTWHQQNLPEKNLNLTSIHFIDGNEGWAVGNCKIGNGKGFSGVILHTKDGGVSWQYTAGKINEINFDRVFFSDPQHGWLATSTSIYRTHDWGKTWRRVLKLPNHE
jgi:photosystem II stability/assembly factor-like uncharacterized protein